MLYVLLAAADVAEPNPTPQSTTTASVPCRDKSGKFSLHCFPKGTVVKMAEPPAPPKPPVKAKHKPKR
jgi:hypothetical protein